MRTFVLMPGADVLAEVYHIPPAAEQYQPMWENSDVVLGMWFVTLESSVRRNESARIFCVEADKERAAVAYCILRVSERGGK